MSATASAAEYLIVQYDHGHWWIVASLRNACEATARSELARYARMVPDHDFRLRLNHETIAELRRTARVA